MTQFNEDDEIHGRKIKDYFKLILLYRIPFLIILVLTIIASIYYAFSLKDIYSSTTKLKLREKKESILEASFPEYSDTKSETFILTQIEILKSYYIRDWVAKALIDSVKSLKNTSNFSILVSTNPSNNTRSIIKQDALRRVLLGVVSFEQSNPKVSVLDIITRDNNFEEARLISSTYAHVFVEYSIEMERLDVTSVKNYLASEKERKFKELDSAESHLEKFQERTGLISLQSQVQNVVENISTYDAEKNKSKIEIESAQNSLRLLDDELNKIDPNFSSYIQSQLNTPYLTEISKKIADLEVNRDLEVATLKDESAKQRVLNAYNEKLAPLKEEFEERSKTYREGILSKTPAEMQNLTGKILDASLSISKARPKYQLLSEKLSGYEKEFDNLPANSIELAKLERARKSAEKLYLILEEKYQEASINERAKLGIASILDPGTDNTGPVGPNRRNIIIFGIFSGFLLGFLYALGHDFITHKIKDPDDLEKPGLKFLTWIPKVEDLEKSTEPQKNLIMDNNIPAAEAFRALRTRVRYSKLKNKQLKTILVTSCLPFEGKSFIAANLAGSFALAGKKTLLLDCDLRKPTVHTIMESERIPGLSDLLYNEVNMENIIRKTGRENFDYITSGTIPKNPSELVGSEQMDFYLKEFEKLYEIIILDCPAFLSVTDSEILYNIADGTILVARSGKTPRAAFQKVHNRLKNINPNNLLGCLLNDFSIQKTFGRYYFGHYSYDYSYGMSGNGKSK
jgi:capsular exopolysaccharide synthesis family protein